MSLRKQQVTLSHRRRGSRRPSQTRDGRGQGDSDPHFRPVCSLAPQDRCSEGPAASGVGTAIPRSRRQPGHSSPRPLGLEIWPRTTEETVQCEPVCSRASGSRTRAQPQGSVRVPRGRSANTWPQTGQTVSWGSRAHPRKQFARSLPATGPGEPEGTELPGGEAGTACPGTSHPLGQTQEGWTRLSGGHRQQETAQCIPAPQNPPQVSRARSGPQHRAGSEP